MLFDLAAVPLNPAHHPNIGGILWPPRRAVLSLSGYACQKGVSLVLADAFASTPDVSAAFTLYASARRAHVRFYQYASWLMTPFFQSDSRGLGWLRDLSFGPMKRIPWLHGEMRHTLAGLKTGRSSTMELEAIVHRHAKP